MNKFEKYFPLPWKSDHIIYLWSANNQTPLMVLDWSSNGNKLLDNVAKIINGEIESPFENVRYDAEDEQTIFIDDKPRFCVRGWGFLNTHLESKEAARVQDEIGEWIVKCLKK